MNDYQRFCERVDQRKQPAARIYCTLCRCPLNKGTLCLSCHDSIAARLKVAWERGALSYWDYRAHLDQLSAMLENGGPRFTVEVKHE